MDNISLLEFCFQNSEDYIDSHYAKDSSPIITTKSTQDLNSLMVANKDILDNITAYKLAVDSSNSEMQDTVLSNILEKLKTPGINFSEFTSYWAIKDISYSIYKSTFKTDSLKMKFLKHIIPEFINDRHNLYKLHGYSHSTMQAISDSKAHKKNGNTGNAKVSKIFDSFNYTHLEFNDDLDVFNNSNKIYFCPDKKGKKLFKKIIDHYNIDFQWSKNHENKKTDFLFKINEKIFIMEHKHMKESGGGQDKQMTEIIDFVSYNDNGVGYISFLDGVYFNLLSDKNITSGKSFIQRSKIYKNLNNNKQNYFINTSGFVKFLGLLD